MKKTPSFSWLLPATALLASESSQILEILHVCFFWALAWVRFSRGSQSVHLPLGPGSVDIPIGSLPWLLMQNLIEQEQGLMMFLNLPGLLPYAPVSIVLQHEIKASPLWAFPALWMVLLLPLCAVPAWSFVGRAIDGFLGKKRLFWGEMILSILLSLVCLTLCGGLLFGISKSERGDNGLFNWGIAGFVSWAALFAFPAITWFRQRKHSTNMPKQEITPL